MKKQMIKIKNANKGTDLWLVSVEGYCDFYFVGTYQEVETIRLQESKEKGVRVTASKITTTYKPLKEKVV